jgi:hypothetical protein
MTLDIRGVVMYQSLRDSIFLLGVLFYSSLSNAQLDPVLDLNEGNPSESVTIQISEATEVQFIRLQGLRPGL